uniref:Tudor domain-containing protein n=1 Tax=Caenorhabditis tropicalis TaxID=1561998 RepID=A0A1I7TK94_9PELO
MHYYKYGIVVHRILICEISKWRIAFFDGAVSDHQLLDVPDRIFDFDPCPGDSVKAKFDEQCDDTPSTITRCIDEWIRDVEIIDSHVVIFAIVHLSENCLNTAVAGEFPNEFFYIIQNENTDFCRIAIPKSAVDKAISERSPLQKPDELLIYRIGVSWDPFLFEGNINVNWRYHKNIPIVPVFELYYRENTLPYLSDSMIYGVLEGIAIAKNENGVLFWTPGMGCAVLSNVTGDIKMPSLGSVSYVLSRRCLPEKSFGFACCYELLPETKETKWNDIKIVTDGMTGSVYIEAHCECILLNKSSLFGMKVPHLGTLYRGLDRYKKKLSVGKSYYFRIEFQKENESHVPVIVDLCLEEDDYVQCRVVHVSQESRQYYAVIEPHGQTFERIKKKIDFIVIPFRVLFCAKGVHVETEELLNNCYVVRVRRPNKDHDVVRGLHVESYRQAAKDPMYSVLNKTVWIRALVRTENDSAGPIVLLCPRLEQRVVDFGRLTSKIPKNTSFAVHAQFALTLENEPVFWARYVAPTVHTLPRVTSRMVASLPNIQDIFDSISKDKKTTPSEQSTEKLKSTSNYLQNNMDKTDIQSARGSSSSANFVITESWAASESSTLARSIDSQRCDQSEASDNTILMDQIATESCYASSICSSSSSSTIRDFDKRSALNVDKMRLDDSFEPRRTLFRYNMPGRYQGFGPSSFRRPQTGGRPRRPMRYGLRQLKTVKKHEEILMDTVYSFMNNRMMFVEHERESRESWFRTPTAKVTTAKKTVAFVIPIETTKCRIERIRSYPRFTDLIRFIVLDTTINVCDASVVIPVGGMFPEMPKSFQLGERYKVDHFSFATDRMCRFAV